VFEQVVFVPDGWKRINDLIPYGSNVHLEFDPRQAV
jgi:hypothetical protein